MIECVFYGAIIEEPSAMLKIRYLNTEWNGGDDVHSSDSLAIKIGNPLIN